MKIILASELDDYLSSLEELDDKLEDKESYIPKELYLKYFYIDTYDYYIHLLTNSSYANGKNNTVISLTGNGIRLSEDLYNEIKEYSQEIKRNKFILNINTGFHGFVLYQIILDLYTLSSKHQNIHYLNGYYYNFKIDDMSVIMNKSKLRKFNECEVHFTYE